MSVRFDFGFNSLKSLRKNSLKMGIDWSEFPPELLEMIANKLDIYIDYVQFRAVCLKWRSFVPSRPRHLRTQFPWLMFSSNANNTTHHLFFDLSANKFYRMNLLETRNSRCCGSSQGWLVLVEKDSPVIRLLNPLTHIQIQLPLVTTLPNALDFNYFKLGKEYVLQTSNGDRNVHDARNIRDSFVKKIVLSSSPISLENDYIALAILNDSGDIAFCKKGVEEWSLIEEAESYCEDAVYHKGAFYAVNQEGSMAICDLSGESPMVTLVALPPLWGHDIVYLVDAFGELWLVTRYLIRVFNGGPNIFYETVDFGVYKFDASKPEWVQMETIGDYMLFLGGNSSVVCLSASDYSGCEGNCIYFTYEDPDAVDGHPDLGVYHLDNGTIVPLPYGEGRSPDFVPQPIWFAPNPC